MSTATAPRERAPYPDAATCWETAEMEKFLKAACEAHGLTALTVTYIADNHEPFSTFPHRGDECGSGSGTTVEAALVEGIVDINRRFPVAALASRQTKETE